MKKQKKIKKTIEDAEPISESEQMEVDIKKKKQKKLKKTIEEAEPVPESEKLEEENESTVVEESTEVFTILGDIDHAKLDKVSRVLPDWLTHPSNIPVDLKTELAEINEINLHRHLIQSLRKHGFTKFFPVQKEVLPVLLKDLQNPWIRSRDICVSAPTGSGKTLAFVLPIIQALLQRKIQAILAVIVLPHQNLAEQIYTVFQTFCEETDIKIGLATGKLQFSFEQKQLVKESIASIYDEARYYSKVHVLVTTPGRLTDHILKTPGFSLEYLQFLVIDEADRTMDIQDNWIKLVENAVYKNASYPRVYTTDSLCNQQRVPFQKLLFSATLSHNPEKLEQLNLFLPRLFSANEPVVSNSEAPDNLEVKVVGKYLTPLELTERYIECEMAEKPLIIIHLLHNLKYRPALCFTNSRDTTTRLFNLLNLFGNLTVYQFSATLSAEKRSAVVKQFTSGQIDVLVCSDLAARGLDIPQLDYIISYDKPLHIKSYIHRIGRTARAGRLGTAIILLTTKEKQWFEKGLQSINKPSIEELKIKEKAVNKLRPKYTVALQKLFTVSKEENH